jgi:hypothetical protein
VTVYPWVGAIAFIASLGALLVLAHMALRGSEPSERPAILSALADLWRREPRDDNKE